MQRSRIGFGNIQYGINHTGDITLYGLVLGTAQLQTFSETRISLLILNGDVGHLICA